MLGKLYTVSTMCLRLMFPHSCPNKQKRRREEEFLMMMIWITFTHLSTRATPLKTHL